MAINQFKKTLSLIVDFRRSSYDQHISIKFFLPQLFSFTNWTNNADAHSFLFVDRKQFRNK